MGANSNSLNQYRDGVICAGTNKGWPLVNQSTDNTGNPNRIYSTNTGTILFGKNTPTIDWNSPTVPDRILYTNGLWNPTSSSSSSSSSKSGKGLAIAGMVFGGLGVLGSIAGPVISIFASKNNGTQNSGFSKSERKEISRNTTNSEDAMTALNSCVNTANSVDENTSAETLADINENLTSAISRAEDKKNEALRAISQAKANKNTKTSELQNEQTVKDKLLNQKATLNSQIDDLKKQLDNPEISDEQKSQIKTQIDQLNKELKGIEEKIEDSQNKIDDIQAEIDVQDEIIKQNTQTANTIEARLTAARRAAAQVDNKIKSKEGN